MFIRRLGSVFGLVLVLAFGAAPDALAHSGSMVEGVLYHLMGDQNPRLGAKTVKIHYVHSEDDGHIVPVDLSNAQMPPGGVAKALNRRVRVTAATGTMVQAYSRSDKLVANKLEVLSPERVVAGDVFPLIGTRKYISLMCKWNGDATEPRTPSFFATQLGNSYPGFDHYFQEVSYGRANINGSSALANWVTTANAQTFFDTSNPDASQYLFPMAQQCVNAAEAAGTDFTGVVGVNLMFNGIVDNCCAWGGSGPLVLDGASRSVSITWMPYWGTLFPGDTFGWLDHGVLGHELSHSFGSPHSDDPSGYQYGNFWDVVSRPGGTCAVVDGTYGCVSQHPVGDNKLAMNFIAPARLATHPVGGAQTTYTIERMASPPNVGGTHQLLKILTSSVNKYYTVEARLRTSYDQNVPGDGVIIHDVISNRPNLGANNPGDPARLITPTGTTAANTGDIDSRWSAGNVYINVTDNIKITVDAFNGATGTATVTVQPATDPGAYSFVLTGTNVIEGNTVAANIAVTRSPPFTAAGSVAWTTANGTALAGTDFGTLGSGTQKTGTLTWTAGTGGVKNITVGLAASNIPVINDLTQDPTRNFTIALSSPVGGILGATTSTTVTINDSDSVISFDGNTAAVSEAGPNTTVQVVRTGATTLSQAVTWRTANGTAVLNGDFGPAGATIQPTGTITFAPGEILKVINIGPAAGAAPYIRINNDTTIEVPETFTIILSAPTNGAVLGADTTMTVTIDSDENGVGLSSSTASFPEGSGAQQLLVTRSGSAGPVSVNFAINNGTAMKDTHFTAPLASGTLSWLDGEGGTKPIAFSMLDDGSPNSARTFTVTLSAASGAALVTPTSTTVSILDNENTVQFSATTATVTEGTATILLTVTRTGFATGQSADVTWTANNGTALAGSDFGTLGVLTAPTGTLHWNAGDLTSRTVTIPILNLADVEGAENFTVVLSSPVGPNLSIGANPQVTVTLNDNDNGIAFALPTYQATEGALPASVTLSVARIGSTAGAATATWRTVNGTATSGQDFGVLGNVAPRTGTLNWLAGDGAAKTIVIPIINDSLGGEGNETFTVELTPGAGLVLGTPGVATVTIIDNDIPPESAVQFSQPKYLVVEGVPSVVLTVNRVLFPPGNSFALVGSVGYTTQPGTALATSDYTTSTGTLNWLAGESAAKTITIPIVNNATPESPESFKVLLSGNSPGLGINTPEATVTIIDDDEVFPLDGAMPDGFSSPGPDGWHVSNDPGAFEGVFALKSDPIDDNGLAVLEMTGVFAAGPVNFRVKVSTEPNFDVLRFYVDGVLSQYWSGTAVAGWQIATTVTLPASGAQRVLRWEYQKDGSVSAGMDAVFIDGLTTPAFTPAP